eukprot:SM000283S10683  [mRNA]  locus=s283:110148:112321:+ [translate_table: standard]
MGKGPGFYSDIGKLTKDLLTKEYTYDQKITVSTVTLSGLAFTTAGSLKGEAFAGDVKGEIRHGRIRTELKVDTASKIHATITVDDVAPGLKGIISGTIPDQKTAKLELQYLNEYSAFTGGIGMTQSPVIDFTAALGSPQAALGGEFTYSTQDSALTKYNFGVAMYKQDFTVAAILADKGETLKGSFLHAVNPYATVGGEIAHSFAKNENTFTLGSAYTLDALTTLKGRVNNHGSVAGLVQHEWRPKSTITISGEVDTKALDKSAKVGLAIALKP